MVFENFKGLRASGGSQIDHSFLPSIAAKGAVAGGMAGTVGGVDSPSAATNLSLSGPSSSSFVSKVLVLEASYIANWSKTNTPYSKNTLY